MNDGTLDYKNYHSVDSLAFGHCDYSYRNLGRPSKLRIRQEAGEFEVTVDDRLCFRSDKVGSQTVLILGKALTRNDRSKCPRATILVLRLPLLRLPIPSKPTSSEPLPPSPSLEKSRKEHNLRLPNSRTTTQVRLKTAQLLQLSITPLNSKTSTTAYKSWLTSLITSSAR